MWRRLVIVASVLGLSGVARAQTAVAPAPGAAYATARQSLQAQGYQPLIFPRGGEFDQCYPALKCEVYREIITCAGAGAGYCRFAFQAPDGDYLIGTTSGERVEQMRLELIGLANAADTRMIENILAGRAWDDEGGARR